jgi:zinc transport system substrate-binding protein
MKLSVIRHCFFYSIKFPLVGVALLLGTALMVGCRSTPIASTDADTVQIVVSIPPQAYFVDRIGGDAVAVETMVPAGSEPHTYEPKPEQLKAISQADAYLHIRVDFEDAWMDRFLAANPQMQVIDTTQGIERLPLPAGLEEEEMTPGSTEGQVDPHIWLSPQLVKVQAETITDTLSQLAPEQASQFQANLDDFMQDIDRLDTDIRSTLEGVTNRRFLVFHPAWGYFARDYDLQMLAIEVGGQEPSAAELANLIRFAQQHQIRVIFASPQFSQRDAETIAKEIGGEVLLIDPLAYDWLNNLQQVAGTFAEVLQPSTALVALITGKAQGIHSPQLAETLDLP